MNLWKITWKEYGGSIRKSYIACEEKHLPEMFDKSFSRGLGYDIKKIVNKGIVSIYGKES